MKSKLLAAVAAACVAGACGAVDLVRGLTDVVIPKNAPDPVLWAAEEATNFLSRVFGEPVGIVNAPRSGRASVILGVCKWTKAAGMDPGKYPRDTYLIKTSGDSVLICGVDDRVSLHKRLNGSGGLEDFQRATSFGLYAFLEKFAGCRFYFPGELGEIVPRADRISVPDTDIVSTPSNLVRKYYSSDRDGVVPDEVKSASVAVKKLNWLRLKMATDNVPCCHGTSRMKIIDRFGKSNPEFFALKSDGSRCNTFTGAPSSRQGHLCFSNPGLRDVIYDECVARFKKGARFVDIMPNDAYPGCCCEGCQKLYNNNDKSDYATDLIWDYTCDIARRLTAAGIKGKVTQMAYHPFQKVPDFDIPDNVAVMVAVHGPWAWSNPRSMKSDRAKIEAWAKKTGGSVWIWAYPHKYGPTLITGIPDVAPRAWGEYYKAMDDLIFGTFAESETDRWSYHYLNYYVFSRVMWDGAKADVDAILDEHYRLMFGPAAAEMKEFYEILEEKWLKGITGNVAMTEIGPVATVPTEGDIWTRVYSDETRSRMDALLKTAASKVAEGSIEARRIAFFRREYYSDFEKGYAEWRERADRVAAQRWDPNSGEKLSLVWYAGDKKSPERVKTTVAASRDGDDLVFTFDCEEPRMDELVAVVRERDDPDAWKDSGVEVFLNPSGDRKHYFHVIVNERGSLFDTADLKPGRSMWGGTHDRNWSPNLSAKVTERADGWTTVLRIPISALGEMQDAFPVEFLRSRMTKTGAGMGYYKWGTISDVLNDLECFGTMVVPKDRGGAAKVVFRPGSTEVVMDKGDCHVVKFAASEMTNFLSRAFGVPVPVVTSRTPGCKAILLGKAAAKAAGIDVKSLAVDEFVVRTVGSDAVAIVGRDHPSRDPAREHLRGLACNFDRATLHGVYAFLEKCAGCRFYFPGELGECVPRIAEFSCEGFGWTERPAYQIRHWYDGNGTKWYGVEDTKELNRLRGLNMLRLRMETDPIPCCHGQNAFRYVERFGKSHPEYFMKLADGTRFNKGGAPGCSKFGQICYSSGAMEELYQDVKAYLTGKPASSRGLKNWGYNCSGGKYVDIMANDAFVRCQCGKCEARSIDDEFNYATEMVWEEVAKIANRLTAEGVKGCVTQMAYCPYRKVPSIDIPTNVLVMVAETGPWTINDKKRLERDNAEIKAWHDKLGRPVWIWTYPGKYAVQSYPGIPHNTPRAIANYYKMVSKDIFGTFMESETDRYLFSHLNYYMLSRVAWDPSFDVDATLDEYYTLMYGAGAGAAKEFLEALEEKWLRGIVGNIIETNLGPQVIQPPDADIWNRTYTKECLAGWRSRLEPFAVGDSIESRRVKMLLEEFLSPLEKQSAAFLDRQAKVAALVYSTGGAPMEIVPFRMAKGSVGEVKTEATIAREGDAIVIGYRCFEPNMSDTKCIVFGKNCTGQMWRNNGVEIYLNPSRDRKHYYHIVMSEKGEYDTFRVEQLGNGRRQPKHDSSWKPDLTVKTGVFDGGYTLEVRIPVAAFGEDIPDEFFANFCRNRILNDNVTFDLYSWSPYVTGYHDPLDFGTVKLK